MTAVSSDLEELIGALQLGEPQTMPANARLQLVDQSSGYLVVAGQVEVFATRLQDGEPVGAMHPVRSVMAGELFFGGEHPRVVLSAVGTATGTEVRPCSAVELIRAAQSGTPAVLDAIERSVASIGEGVVELDSTRVGYDPAVATLVLGTTTEVTIGTELVTVANGLWVDGTSIELVGRSLAGIVPLPPGWHAAATTDGPIQPVDAKTALSQDAGILGLQSFIAVALDLLVERLERIELADADRLDFLAQFEGEVRASAYAELGSVLSNSEDPIVSSIGRDDFLSACRIVANAAGIKLVDPPRSAFLNTENPIEVIARYARLRTRTVLLTRGWWQHDGGPFLTRMEESQAWVALIPHGPHAYEIVRPDTGERIKVTAAIAAEVGFEGYQFYRPLPRTAVTGREVLRYVLHDIRPDLFRMLAMGIGVGLLSLLPTVVAEVLFNTVVPAGERAEGLDG